MKDGALPGRREALEALQDPESLEPSRSWRRRWGRTWMKTIVKPGKLYQPMGVALQGSWVLARDLRVAHGPGQGAVKSERIERRWGDLRRNPAEQIG